MLASSQIKVVKPPDKKPYISDMGRLSLSLSFNFNFFGRNCYNILLPGLLQKHDSVRILMASTI